MGQKLELLKSACKRGPLVFLNQAYVTGRDTLWSQKHLVFRISGDRLTDLPAAPDLAGLSFRAVHSWADLSAREQERLSNDHDSLEWGEPSWFDAGWKLYIGEVNGALATLCWWRTAAQSSNFFCPVAEDEEVLWQTVTLSEFRGRKLYFITLLNLMALRHRAGASAFYISCRDYNSTSRRTFCKCGFEQIGYTRINKITQKRVWCPRRAEPMARTGVESGLEK
jgi:hypothetical protein